MGPALDAIRSLLFVPGDDERKLLGAPARGADALIVDLEDAVSPQAKAAARETVARALAAMPAAPPRLLRINAADTSFHEEDLALLEAGLSVDGVVLPKATVAGLERVGALGLPLLALIESAAGVRAAYELASHPLVVALMLGAVDLSAELGLSAREDGLEILHARSKLVLDARAAGIRAPFDGVHLRIDDADGLLAQCRLARSLGMRGKACIHPGQIAIVHAAFAPTAEEVAWARRVVEATGGDPGVRAVDGVMVDVPVLAQARGILADADR